VVCVCVCGVCVCVCVVCVCVWCVRVLCVCMWINPSNAELNPICHLPALLAHHILHVGRIRINSHAQQQAFAIFIGLLY